MAVSQYVGARIKRIEDPKLIRGEGAYLDDLRLAGTLHAVFIRSPHGHARIRAIDLRRARAHPGVAAVLAAGDLPEIQRPLPVVPVEGRRAAEHLPLAATEVCYAGEAVAVVVAQDPYIARDAADLVEIAYDALPAAIDLERAARGAPFAHAGWDTNVGYTSILEQGDLAAAFRDAPVVVRRRMLNQRVAPVSLEPRGTLAMYDGSLGQGLLTVWTSTQEAHSIRDGLSQVLGLEASRIRVVTPAGGGGLGGELNTYPEDAVVAHLARRLRRPVKWVETRQENLLTTTHGRGQVIEVEVSAERDGRIRGMRSRVLADLGASLVFTTAIVPTLTPLMIQGTYEIPALRCELIALYTNTCPTGAYRGAGRPEASYYLERVMDLVADEAGVDPAEVRRRNFIPSSRFPCKAASGATYDSGDYAKPLDEVLRIADYKALRTEQAAQRRNGKILGVGLAS